MSGDNPASKISSASKPALLLSWVGIPLLLVSLVCILAAPWVRSRESGYIALLESPPKERLDALFIGQSRVEAAINTEMFNKTVMTQGERPCTSANLGGHGRTPAVNYMGLRLLLQKMPQTLKGCTVFVEAPGGIPQADRWNQPWVNPGEDRAIIPLLTSPEIATMAHASAHNPMLTQLGLRLLQAESHVSLVYYRHIAGRRMIQSLQEISSQAAEAMHLPPGEVNDQLDIQTGGTIVNEASAAAVGLNSARSYIRQQQGVPATTNWNETILEDIRQELARAGAHLAVYTMPVHSMFVPTEQRQSVESLRSYCAEHGVLLLEPEFKAADSDFPDYWHLTREQGEEFSHKLAEAWLKAHPGKN